VIAELLGRLALPAHGGLRRSYRVDALVARREKRLGERRGSATQHRANGDGSDAKAMMLVRPDRRARYVALRRPPERVARDQQGLDVRVAPSARTHPRAHGHRCRICGAAAPLEVHQSSDAITLLRGREGVHDVLGQLT
jgi:hypothetical protein